MCWFGSGKWFLLGILVRSTQTLNNSNNKDGPTHLLSLVLESSPSSGDGSGSGGASIIVATCS